MGYFHMNNNLYMNEGVIRMKKEEIKYIEKVGLIGAIERSYYQVLVI